MSVLPERRTSLDVVRNAHLGLWLRALAKLFADEFQIIFVKGFFLPAVTVLALPLDYMARIGIGLAALLFLLVLVLVNDETFANLKANTLASNAELSEPQIGNKPFALPLRRRHLPPLRWSLRCG